MKTAEDIVKEKDREIKHWKANHADQVRRNKTLCDRVDIPEGRKDRRNRRNKIFWRQSADIRRS